MTMTIETELPTKRDELHDAISALIDPRPEQANGQTCWINPRYHELRDALDSQRIGSSSSQPQSKPPAWLDAIELLTRIDHQARKLEPNTPILACDDYPTVQRLRAYNQRKWRPQDVETITTVTAELMVYAGDIDKLFAQAPKYLPDNCPRCSKKRAEVGKDDLGKPIWAPALQITDSGASCNHCHAHWPPNMLAYLGRLLGYRIQGVIE